MISAEKLLEAQKLKCRIAPPEVNSSPFASLKAFTESYDTGLLCEFFPAEIDWEKA